MSSNLLALYTCTRSSTIKHLKPYLPTSTRRLYNQQSHNEGHDAEKAPSTAEEFQRVAEEKSRQGFSSQTVQKVHDAALEAVEKGTATDEKVKEAFIESPESGANFHKKG